MRFSIHVCCTILSFNQKLALESIFLCCLESVPIIADWKLRALEQSEEDLYFECQINAGYVRKDDEAYVFLDKPTMRMLNVSVEVSVSFVIHCLRLK